MNLLAPPRTSRPRWRRNVGPSLAVALLVFVAFATAHSQESGKDYSDQDLTGKDFSGASLNGANFSEATLKGADFTSATLKRANFRGADLSNTRFPKADLTEADFRESVFSPFLSATDLSKANLEGLNVNGAGGDACKFRGANLKNTKGWGIMHGCDFSNADVRGANFRAAQFTSGIRFRNAVYDEDTTWPSGFDPAEAGAKLSKGSKREGADDDEPRSSRKSAESETDEPPRKKKSKAADDDEQ